MIMAYGLELNISPIASLQNINVIEGKLSMGGSMIAALIKGSGKYNYRQIEVSDKQAKIMFFEDGEEVGNVSYTMEEARRAGLANKFNWKKNTKDMLWWRAMSRGARRFCPDIFNGSIYTPEELTDGEQSPTSEGIKVEQKPESLPPVEKKTVIEMDEKEKKDELHKVVHEAFKDKEVKVVRVDAPEPEKKKEPSKKRTSAAGVMLSFMRAVDSCEEPEELDTAMDDWEETLKELPRGFDECLAYWKVRCATFDATTTVDEQTVAMAEKLSAMKN